MELSYNSLEIIKQMAQVGNPNSVSDAGVGALCARAAVMGAFLNVKINATGLKDRTYADEKVQAGQTIVEKTNNLEADILKIVEQKISSQ